MTVMFCTKSFEGQFKELPFLRIVQEQEKVLQCDQWYSILSPRTLAGLMESICDDHHKPERRFKEDSLWF